jgi:glutamate dehydrogenase/leucine dehydrogenase
VRSLLLARQGNTLTADNLLSFEEINEQVWSVGADIFIPAASSRLVARPQVEQLLAGGLKVISCGANVPFADPEIFFGPTGEYADQHTAVVPDFIANCGMARVFAYLMETGAEITDQAIFADTSRIIGAALERTHRENSLPTGIAQRSFEMALRQLV